MTPCTRTLEELSAYLDGELGPEEAGALQYHLSICASCQRKVKVLAALEEAIVRSAEVSAVPQTLHEYVSVSTRPSPWSFLRHFWPVNTALACALLLAVVSVTGWWWRHTKESVQDEIAQVLVADHIHYLQAPDALEIASADPAVVTEWFRGQVPFPVQIPQVNDVHLLGGRLCSLLGQRAALVLYEHKGRRLSLFILAADAILPGKRKGQETGHVHPSCLDTVGNYVLCLGRSENVAQAVVTEGPEAEEIASRLFHSL